MPLSGVICCRTGEPSRFDSCVNCAKYGSPEPCKHPFPVITAMRDNKSARESSLGTISTTELLGCHRFQTLAEGHDYYEDPEDFKARFKGTLVHAGLDAITDPEEDAINEVRFFKDIDIDGTTYTISGTPDVILPEFRSGDGKGRIIDGKSAGRRKLHQDMEASDDHVRQVNIYRWLLWNGYRKELGERDVVVDEDTVTIGSEKRVRARYQIDSAVIWYIGDTDLREVEVPVWPIHVVEGMIVSLLQNIHDHQLEPILPSTYVKRRATGLTEEVRHYKCVSCPLRSVCDTYPPEGIKWQSTK